MYAYAGSTQMQLSSCTVLSQGYLSTQTFMMLRQSQPADSSKLRSTHTREHIIQQTSRRENLVQAAAYQHGPSAPALLPTTD